MTCPKVAIWKHERRLVEQRIVDRGGIYSPNRYAGPIG